MPALFHICIGGPTGAGKTVLAYNLERQVTALRHALVLDNDQVRRDLRGYDLRAIMRDADYTPEVTAQVRAKMDEMTREALGQGRPVIDSTGFWGEESRAAAQALSKACGAAFKGFWLCVPHEVLQQRILRRLKERQELPELSGERGHASDACLAVLDKYAPLMPTSAPEGWHPIDASVSEAEVVKACVLLLTS